MLHFTKTVTINAPRDQIFQYLTQERVHLPEIWPSLLEIKDVKLLPTGGYTFAYVYKMAGMKFEGMAEDTEFVPFERFVTKTKGAIESTFVFAFEPLGAETKVVLDVTYAIPSLLLAKFVEPFIALLNERDAELFLSNLKARIEAKVLAAAVR